MANTINYASKYSPKIIETFIDNSYVVPFVTTNVDWLDAKTFHFTQLSVGGYKNHVLTGGWNRQSVTESDKSYTLSHDRDVEFLLDKREVDESNKTATIENVSVQFEMTQGGPEKDASFFEAVSTVAIANSLASTYTTASYTVDNVLSRLKTIIGNVRRYRTKGLICYVNPTIMDLLALSSSFTRQINSESIVMDGKAIQTRITDIDGTPVVEIVETERFSTAFDYSDGFTASGYDINVLCATPLTTKLVPKISSIYMFAPGEHTEGDGYLYQNRAFWDTFVLPNGKDGNIDSVYVDYDSTSASI